MNRLERRNTFKIKLPMAIFIFTGSLFWACALIWILYSMLREGSYISLADQAKIALFMTGLAMMVYGLIVSFLFEITADEERIQIRNPFFSWGRPDRYTLRWKEIEKLDLEPFLFVESKRYVLKPKKNSGKKSLRFPSAIANFRELAELISEKVEVTPLARGAIEYDLTSHKLTLRRFLLLMVVSVVILVIACLFLGIIHFPSFI